MEKDYDGGWKTGDIGERKVIYVMGLVFESLMPKMTVLGKTW